ncbi:restriction endonuclease subunit S [Nocardia salmonicida]|uniref:restriction endonuclease subunit S n=1 Tax=Nocardia salmonicida TaxID=53431 RepID=UPI0036B2E4CF
MSGWPMVALSEVCYPKQWPTISHSEFTEHGFPVYGANGQIGFYSKYNHEESTVLITCRGATCGAINVCPPRSYVTGNAMALDRLDRERVDLRYLVYALTPDRLRRSITGSAQPQITRASLQGVEIPLPPTVEQRRIAAILDHAGALRAKRREALARLDELTQSIFIDMFGQNDRDVGDEPPLGDKLTFLTSGSRGWAKYYTDAGDLFIRIQNVGSDELRLNDVAYVQPPVTAEAQRTRVQVGDVLLSITADLGRTAVVDETAVGGYVNQHLAILRSNEYEPAYLSRYLSSPAGQHQISSKSRGGTKAGLNFDDVRSLRVPCPPLEDQRIFARRAQAVDTLRRTHRTAIVELDALFASLQSRAFRGEL